MDQGALPILFLSGRAWVKMIHKSGIFQPCLRTPGGKWCTKWAHLFPKKRDISWCWSVKGKLCRSAVAISWHWMNTESIPEDEGG